MVWWEGGSVDLVKMAVMAERLIAQSGRAVTIIKFNTTPADAAQPWKGAADPRVDPDGSVSTTACFVEPSSMVSLGMSTVDSDLVKQSTKIMLVSPGETISEDLTKYDEVIDFDGTRWKIVTVETLQPAENVILYYIGVAQ